MSAPLWKGVDGGSSRARNIEQRQSSELGGRGLLAALPDHIPGDASKLLVLEECFRALND